MYNENTYSKVLANENTSHAKKLKYIFNTDTTDSVKTSERRKQRCVHVRHFGEPTEYSLLANILVFNLIWKKH